MANARTRAGRAKAAGDRLPEPRADLIAAAHAAVRWAHARRATWTDEPLAVVAPAVPPPLPAKPAAKKPSGPSVAVRAAARVRALGTPVWRWLPRVAAIAVLLAAGLAAGVVGSRYAVNTWTTWRARTAVVKPAPPPAPRPVPTTGSLSVSSTPTGAQVIVDGKARGVTPLTIPELSAGRHTIELRSGAGIIHRTVTIAAGKTVEVDESIFSGWVAVFAPFDVVVTEGGRQLPLDDRHLVMLPPGRHELRIANRALGFETVRQVELKPGETTRLSITPPPSTMTVTASEPSEVWLDGVRIGVTPVSGVRVALGTHEIVVRRANGDVRRFTVTVTVNPLTLNVDFSRPGV